MFQQPLSALPRGQNSYSAAIGEEEKGEERKKKRGRKMVLYHENHPIMNQHCINC